MTDVVLLTKEDCDLCDHAKETLDRLTAEFRLSVREVRLESSEGRELAGAAAAPFPPVVFMDGEPFSYGRLSERKLRKLLVARGH